MASKSLVILASGTGSNARKIIEHLSDRGRDVRVTLLSDKRSSGIYDIGAQLGAKAEHMTYVDMKEGTLLTWLNSISPDLIVLAGFMRMIPMDVVHEYGERMVNIHPALLPKYGGKGMYGDHVHNAVLEARERESGITIHYVNEQFDEGQKIAQFYCTVEESDSLESLRKRVQGLEHRYFPLITETLLYEL